MELINIKGIGSKTIDNLHKLNIYTVDDLIRYYPYRYNVYRPMDLNNVSYDDTLVLVGKVASKITSFKSSKIEVIHFNFETCNKLIKVSLYGRSYIAKSLYIGKYITLIGKYEYIKNNFNVSDIKLYPINSTEIESVYHLVNGIKKSFLTRVINNTLASIDNINDLIPSYINERYNLLDELKSVREIHKPSNIDMLKKAEIKLKYEELFVFMFKINLLKIKNKLNSDFIIKNVTNDMKDKLLSYIPFELTSDQNKALDDIINDFNDVKRMNRLILGDVGSGKTIVAFLACILNSMVGYQSAILVPTEVLAKQHYDNFISLFSKLNLNVCLLTGSSKEKDIVKTNLKNGNIDILIGTHALLEDSVSFKNLGLVVTDEQHRFGVNQRKSLQNKGKFVDVLYMSATPIPRTYALTIYGDMDISMIKTRPKGRKDIITTVHKFKDINIVCNELKIELNNNHQAYVVSPLIENDDEATNELSDLKKIKKLLEDNLTNKYNIGILHGKMKDIDKENIMNDFKNHKIDILISTTVIEVGIDVSNATMMIIFNAERFGLSTLHQLRGRVGRNSLQSKCILISDSDSERLNVMEESNDGFYISEQDFKLRGSGDLFGIKQHGDMSFKIADLTKDYKILLQCQKDSEEFINNNIENNFRDYKYYQELVNNIIDND